MSAMRLLVIGGTSFVGRALVEEALRRGHDVTTFNRGRTGADVPGVRVLRGDRSSEDDLGALSGRAFDAVLDPGGQVPAQVLRAARALWKTVPFYAFVSSAAVYRDWTDLPWREDAPTHASSPEDDSDPADMRLLGPRKAGCEQAVHHVYGVDASLVVRPGLIVGPHDNVGMLPWWLSRVGRGGGVLAPGCADRPLQVVDARDLAVFMLDRVESRLGGVFNTMPEEPVATMGDLLSACLTATGARAELVWVEDDFLLAHGGQPWNEIPFWLPAGPNPAAAWPVSGAVARRAGLTCRPLGRTVADTWEWLREGGTVRPMPGVPPLGLDPRKERRILDAWASRHEAG